MSLRSDLRPAVTGVWLILSGALAAAAAAPFVAPAEVLYGLFPECEAKRSGSACSLCGMTTAFVLISRGDLDGARESNRASVILWPGSLANFAAAIAYSIRALIQRRRYSGGHRTCSSSP